MIPSPLHPTRPLLTVLTVAVYLHLASFYSVEISDFQNQWRRFCSLSMDERSLVIRSGFLCRIKLTQVEIASL